MIHAGDEVARRPLDGGPTQANSGDYVKEKIPPPCGMRTLPICTPVCAALRVKPLEIRALDSKGSAWGGSQGPGVGRGQLQGVG